MNKVLIKSAIVNHPPPAPPIKGREKQTYGKAPDVHKIFEMMLQFKKLYRESDLKACKLIIVLTMVFLAASGCKKEDAVINSDEFLIAASFYPVYIIALNVAWGIDGVRVVNMTPPFTGCLHDYSVTAGDMKNLENADIFIVNGAGMENFMDKIAGRYPGLKTAELSEGIRFIKDINGVNPHVWLNTGNAVIMTQNCARFLSDADGKHADLYKKNAAKYIKELTDLKEEMRSSLEKFKGEKIITFHEAFPYFAEEHGLDIAAVVEREPGSEPSARELSGTINLVRKMKIKNLFAEPQYPSASADVIARETGAKVYILDPAVSGDDDKGSYIKIMKKNLSVLVSSFSDK